MKKRVRNISISLALLLGVALTALAADAPRLQIQSPSENAAIPALPGGSGVVSIKFKTDHFKVISLKDAPALNSNQSQNASTSSPSANPAESNPSPSNAGMGRSTAPGAPSSGTMASNQPAPESLPQSDVATSAAPPAKANPNQGFIDVNVDGSPWHFLHSNSDNIVIAGLAPGAHKIALQLIGSDFRPVGSPQTVDFTVSGASGK